ncbi:hypothetical protein [Variovorax sp. 278MFTsu5.1]|uniref:hypothetical protein n=1 Tax=Variovorax sp. 278MFTsu5.1 TaxID=3158366 RepID=UPI003AAD0985
MSNFNAPSHETTNAIRDASNTAASQVRSAYAVLQTVNPAASITPEAIATMTLAIAVNMLTEVQARKE